MSGNKEEVISFKADPGLADSLRRLPNRSDFIRRAVLHALNQVCPLCQGSGSLTREQRSHWREFTRRHSVTECTACGSLYLTCDAESGDEAPARRTR